MRTPTLGLALLTATFLVGCASAPPATNSPAPTPTVAAVQPDDALNAVLWAQRAVEHDLILGEIYRDAGEKLAAALADPTWDALPSGERDGSPESLPPAVILDVDETVLDNSPYQAQLVRSGAEYNDFTWSEWCRKASARPLAGALEFTRLAAQHGVTVFYVTNRAVDLGPATLANLRKDGFPVRDDGVVLGLGTVLKGCETFGSNKGCRRRLVGRDYRVLMQFGDQIGDFVDVIANTVDARAQSVAPYADWFGERWFVLPNPMYGSWEPACFNNDWRLPRAERRAKKIESLRDN